MTDKLARCVFGERDDTGRAGHRLSKEGGKLTLEIGRGIVASRNRENIKNGYDFFFEVKRRRALRQAVKQTGLPRQPKGEVLLVHPD